MPASTKNHRGPDRRRLSLERRADGWWIRSDVPGVDDMGPYQRRREAEDDLRGVRRTVRRERW